MDVVVTNIPPKYGMLLSRSWGEKLKGSLQMDMSYATISVFRQPRKLSRETLMNYMVSSEEKPNNYHVYYVHSNMDSFILYNDICLEEDAQNLENKSENNEGKMLEAKAEFDDDEEGMWNMDFDGAISKEESGAGVWIRSQEVSKSKTYYYKLAFECTNNVFENEPMILGLQLLKRSGAKRISVHGDS